MKKQFIAKLLVLAMILAMVPATLLAASAAGDTDPCNTGCQGQQVPDDTKPSQKPDDDNTKPIELPAVVAGITASTDTSKTEEKPTTTVDKLPENGAVEAEVVNGVASVGLSAEAVKSLANLAKDGEIVLEIKAVGAGKVSVTFPAEALTALAKETGAALTIKSNVATITIPNDVLSGQMGTVGNVKITVESTSSNVGFDIEVDGEKLDGLKGVKVEF